MIPKAITLDLLQSSPDVFRDLCLYIQENKSRVTGQAPEDFPVGLKLLRLIVELDTGINTSGLWGYLSDVTNDDGTVSEVGEVMHVLTEMQATHIVAILAEAMELWKEFLNAYRPAICMIDKHSFEDFQRIRRMREGLERQLDPLDSEYFHARHGLSKIVREYARQHPELFLHPAMRPDDSR